jgi:hypothetical protein
VKDQTAAHICVVVGRYSEKDRQVCAYTHCESVVADGRWSSRHHIAGHGADDAMFFPFSLSTWPVVALVRLWHKIHLRIWILIG